LPKPIANYYGKSGQRTGFLGEFTGQEVTTLQCVLCCDKTTIK